MNIRNILIAAGSALALTAVATAASAATVSATANASVTVISPTTLSKITDLVFGTVVRPTSGTSTITMSTAGTVTESGPGDGSVVASTTSAAKFNLATQTLITYSLVPTLTFTQAGLTNVTVSAPVISNPTPGPGQLAAAGNTDITYGASFDMTPATTAQAYTGTLTVVVTYN